MIKENDIYSLIHYEYGLPYSGDYNGMRYRIARNPLERVFGKKEKGEATLETTVWKGPFAFDTTTWEDTTYLDPTIQEAITKEFPFTEEGRLELVEWLNAMYETDKDKWKTGKISNVLKS